MMRQVFLSGFLSSCVILGGSGLAHAADIGYDGYGEKVYQDHAYIDKTLDDFEKRNGIYKGDKFQYEDDIYNEKDYSEKKHGLKDYDLRSERDEKCERDEQITLECLHPRQIRRRLVRRGWHDFKILREGPRRIRMVATNHNGRRFKLVVSRCDGVIVRRRPLNRYWGYNRPRY